MDRGSGEEERDSEDSEDSAEYAALTDELQEYFRTADPGADVDPQGLLGRQRSALEASARTVADKDDLVRVLVATIHNVVDLSSHLLTKNSYTETELLAAVARLEERRGRHEELKQRLGERKREMLQASKEGREAGLRAEVAERRAELLAAENQGLRGELETAQRALEAAQRTADGEGKRALEVATLRGRTAAVRLAEERHASLEMLTKELEALELSAARPTINDYSNLSESDSEPLGGRSGRWQLVVGELAADNALLQRTLLRLIREKTPPNAQQIQLMETAARTRAEQALQQALEDKTLLEKALLKSIRGR